MMAQKHMYSILFAVLYAFTLSNAQYIGNASSKFAFLKKSVHMICQSTNGAGKSLVWYRDNEPVAAEKQGHYIVKSSDSESKLTIKIFVKNDSEVKNWSVKTNKAGFPEPTQCQFGPIRLRASPQSIDTGKPKERLDSDNSSVRRIEGESVSFTCNIEPNRTQSNPKHAIKWQFSSDGKIFKAALPDGVKLVSEEKISIDGVKKSHRGYYRCLLNGESFTALLRVKDPLAALWPFLGIVTIVVVLVIVILIFEKRHKSTRKTVTTEDDENDHARDPLVRSANKSSDNENKKRAIKT